MQKGDRWVIEVTNWIFKPSDFGKTIIPPQDANGDPKLAKFAGNSYPLPWKNTCPMCRGVGLSPWYKIRHIFRDLFAGRSAKALAPGPVAGIPADPDATQTGPESWEEANNRVVLHESYLLQVEVPLMVGKYVLPAFGHQNKPWTGAGANASLSTLTDGTNGTPNLKRFKFAHPLQFKNVKKQLITLPGVTVAAGDAQGRDTIVPDTWGCYVPFTMVQMGSPIDHRMDDLQGRVIFNEPVFIPCHYDWAQIQVLRNNVARIDETGLLSVHTPARGYETSDASGLPTGYWRPARVWMIFKYAKEKYYHDGTADPDNRPIAETAFAANPWQPPPNVWPLPIANPAGAQQYVARAGIMDGRYYVEVRRAGNPPSRAIQTVIEDQYSKLCVFEDDFWKMTVPPGADLGPDAGGDGPQERPCTDLSKGAASNGSEAAPARNWSKMAGYAAPDYFANIRRPKVRWWYLRDDRSRMLGLAVRRLELTNQVQVSGSLRLIGPTNDTTVGLGYVDYPNRGLADVVRVTYSFSEGFSTELELHREECRIGELPPKDKDRQDHVEKEVQNLKRIVAIQQQRAAAGGGAANAGNAEKQIDAGTVTVYTGGV